MTFAIFAPVFKGDTCSALPSARAYLIVFAVIQLATVPLLLYTNAMRINKGFNPHMNCDVRAYVRARRHSFDKRRVDGVRGANRTIRTPHRPASEPPPGSPSASSCTSRSSPSACRTSATWYHPPTQTISRSPSRPRSLRRRRFLEGPTTRRFWPRAALPHPPHIPSRQPTHRT